MLVIDCIIASNLFRADATVGEECEMCVLSIVKLSVIKCTPG